MRRRDSLDALAGLLALVGDAIGVYAGFALATWIRFDSGWVPPLAPGVDPPRGPYYRGALVATAAFLLIFRALGLYRRPQLGRFEEKIPRLFRAVALGIFATMALTFLIRTEAPGTGAPFSFSRATVLISFFTILLTVGLERYLLFRYEWHLYRHRQHFSRCWILGTDAVAARLAQALRREPRLGARVAGFLRVGDESPDPGVPADQIRGTWEDLPALVERGEVDQVALTRGDIGSTRIMELMALCERNLVGFQMVPDLFRVLTSRVDVQTVGGIPLLGMSRWPLDYFWNRFIKRLEDIVGATIGLLLSAPVIAVAAILIKRSSPGPVFYRQERCGEDGRVFQLIKLRTMRVDAEAETGPVWAVENDPRRTPVGAFLRRHNLDELPQFWNVLKGDMSLVGPRPERPHFVEIFKDDVRRYMWRHAAKPGMTGWAQVNGLRGNTDIRERIAYDLFYLENWSLALDFKILAMTFFARRNAY